MALKLYYHPLSSYCHKVLIALYENATAFEPYLVDLGNPAERDKFRAIWPIGKFPVIHDNSRGETVAESSIIIEYLDHYYPGRKRLIPADSDNSRRMRFLDRLFDLHVHEPMQRIVGDRLRPKDRRDPLGVEQARESQRTALQFLDREMRDKQWALGDSFSMADCAAAPALFYTNKLMTLESEFPHLASYLDRLAKRPSYARALIEAEPYMKFFPAE